MDGKTRYVYLDSNVIQYMKHGRRTETSDGREFRKLVAALSRRYVFPFSQAHLLDLLPAGELIREHRSHIEHDLEFLNAISHGFALQILSDGHIVPSQEVSIHQFFHELMEDTKDVSTSDLQISGGVAPVNLDLMARDNPLRPILEENGGTMDVTVMRRFIEKVADSFNDPEFHKHFRRSVIAYKDYPDASYEPLAGWSFLKQMEPFGAFLAESDPSSLAELFTGAVQSFLSITNNRGQIPDIES